MKILNLYGGIGGNRKLWGDEHEITAVEWKQEIADIYKEFFPRDTVVVGDAHDYLLKHYKEFDFIWSSPPCPTHSLANTFLNAQGIERFPDMKLYEEIIFLKHWFKGKWVVENVIPYYTPLIPAMLIDRHYFWSNFMFPDFAGDRHFNIANGYASTRRASKDDFDDLQKYHGITLDVKKHKKARLLLRNCVYPPIGKHILDWSQKEWHHTKSLLGNVA